MRWLILILTMCSYLVIRTCGDSSSDLSGQSSVRGSVRNNVTVFEEPNPPEVTIAQGKVIGSLAPDGTYYSFYGIPYADSTSGSHRFKAPRPPPSFQDPFIANRNNIKCVRAVGVGHEGIEDCLVANVFTPSLNNMDRLSVMVWIKGTEFDRTYQQELSFRNFMQEDVIVVSLNYRESILGFLCLGTEAAPGNAGLKDIIAGLRWVKENIVEFGGNPNDITIFGHGSGGAAVDLISLSPMADGLVNKVIAQSGNAMAPWAVSRDNLQYAIQVAEYIGHVVTDIQQLSEIYETINIAPLMSAINLLDLTKNALAFAPCIEKEDLEGGEPFLIKTPREILNSKDFLPRPFIAGFVDNEGTIRAEEALEEDWLDRMNTEFVNFLQADLNFETDKERSEVAQQIKEFYFGDDPIAHQTINDYIKYHGDTMVLVSSIQEVRMRAEISPEPTYLYKFSYKGTLGEPFMGPLNVTTAAHSEELAYLFHHRPSEDISRIDKFSENISSMDLIIGQLLVERWTNFAKTGNPMSNMSELEWLPFSEENSNYLNILASHEDRNDDEEIRIEESLTDPHPDILEFWNHIYENHFLDAESHWRIDDDDDVTPSTQEPDEDDVTPSTQEPDEDDVTPSTPEPIENDDIVVSIAQGQVIGSVASDGDYYQFLGIPYADSTAGAYRFKAPRAPPLFEEPFIANRNDIKCVKPLGIGFEGTEDCLVASIFTPTIESTSELPVMVWIKGMEFDTVNEHELSFRNFMQENVVVVSLNYRESILGFLCLGTEIAPGNAGLKDIIAGLQWVKENIEEFGGNPNDITIFGHGSGGAAVDLVSLSPMAENLVHKAIAQSGNAMAPWAVSRDNLKYAIQVAEALGHVVINAQQLSEMFTRVRLDALMEVINKFDITENALAFGPCIEREELQGDKFLIKTPFEILSSGEFQEIPFMTGFVDNEGTIRANEAFENNWLNRMDLEFEMFLQADLKFESDDEKSLVAEKIRQFYFEDKHIDLITFDNYTAYHGETMVLVSAIREVRMRAEASSEPTYLYQFSYKGTVDAEPQLVERAAHGEELIYLFHASSEEASDTDLTIAQILVERWTSFAKTGVPTSTTSNVIWKPFTTENTFYMRIIAAHEIIDTENAPLEVSLVDPHPESLLFWDEIYEHHFLDAESNWNLNVDVGNPVPPIACPACPNNSTALMASGFTLLAVIYTIVKTIVCYN